MPTATPTMLPTIATFTVSLPANGSAVVCEQNVTIAWSTRGDAAVSACPVVDIGLFAASGTFLAYIAVDHANDDASEQYTWSTAAQYCGTDYYKVRVKCSYEYQGFSGVFQIGSAPTTAPTALPSRLPSAVPSFTPSRTPTALPSRLPSAVPSFLPSGTPTPAPSRLPTAVPAAVPTSPPVPAPTGVPWSTPTPAPTKCFLDVCPAGFSCAGGNWTECAAGTYSVVGATSCQACQAGRYADASASGSCAPCPAGYACADAASTPVVCSPGSYALGNATACLACPAGAHVAGGGGVICMHAFAFPQVSPNKRFVHSSSSPRAFVSFFVFSSLPCSVC